MTAKQFDHLWVGSLVHIDNWAWRVKAINRPRGLVLVRKLPETVLYSIGGHWAHYSGLGYVATQKPPPGYFTWDEDREF